MSYRSRDHLDAVMKYESVKSEPSDLDCSLDGIRLHHEDPMLLDGGISDQDSNLGSPIPGCDTDHDLLFVGRNMGLDGGDDDVVIDSRSAGDLSEFGFAAHGTAHSYETGRLSPGGFNSLERTSASVNSASAFGGGSSVAGSARSGGPPPRYLVSSTYRSTGHRYKQWTDEQMERAMQLVQQHNFSNAKAARETGVPESSLRERLRRSVMRGERPYLSSRKRRFAGGYDDPEPGISMDDGPSDSGSIGNNKMNDALCFVLDHRLSIVTVSKRLEISPEVLRDNVRNVIVSNALVPVNNDTCLTTEQERLIVKWVHKRQLKHGFDWELTLSAFKSLVRSAVHVVEHLRSNHQKVFLSELVDENCRKYFLSRNKVLLNSYSQSGFGSFVVSSSDDRNSNMLGTTSLGASNSGLPPNTIISSGVLADRHSQSSVASVQLASAGPSISAIQARPEMVPLVGASTSPSLSVLVLQTGGDIDKEFLRTHRGNYVFEIAASPSAQPVFSRFCPSVQFFYASVCRKDSQDVSNADIAHLCTMCRENPAERILITHGIDSILDTAQILASGSYNKILVLTGAMIPPTLKDSDVEFNLGFALGALQCLSEHGVYVAMDGRVSKWNEIAFDKNTRQFVTKQMR